MKKLKLHVSAIVFVLFIISTAVVLTLNFRALYRWDAKRLNLPEETGYSMEEILRNYDTLIDYNSILNQERLVFPTMPMSETAEIHFVEVKRIFCVIQVMMLVTCIAAFCIYNRLTVRMKITQYLKWVNCYSVGIALVVGGAIFLNWDRTFVIFHKIFFRNDYWLFSAETDPIITVLPDEFFMHCALLILALIVLGNGIVYWLYRKETRKV